MKKKSFLFLLFLIGLFVVYSPGRFPISIAETHEKLGGEPLGEVRNLLDEGREYLKLDKLEEARIKFQQAMEIAPPAIKRDIKNLISMVETSLAMEIEDRKKVVRKAEEEAKRIAELESRIIRFEEEKRKAEKQKRIDGYLEKGRAHYRRREYEKALQEFQKILLVDPENRDAITHIKRTETAMERDREEQIGLHWGKAKRHYRARRYDEAIEELKKLLAIDPTNKNAIEYMALAQERKLAAREVARKIKEAERLEDMVRKGKKYYRERNYDKAIEIWQEVLKEKKDYPRVKILIEQAQVAKMKEEGKVVEAKKATERERKMLEVDKAHVPPYVRLEREVGSIGERGEGMGVNPRGAEVTMSRDQQLIEAAREDKRLAEALRRKAMEKRIQLINFKDKDLREAMVFLSNEAGVNIIIDEAIFGAVAPPPGVIPPPGVGEEWGEWGPPGVMPPPGVRPPEAVAPVPTIRVTAFLRDVPLLAALDLILRGRGLDYVILPHAIWVSTPERIRFVVFEPMVTKHFDLEFGMPMRRVYREPLAR